MMKTSIRLKVLAVFLLSLLPAVGRAGPMRAELKLAQPKGKSLRNLFEVYGYQPRRTINADAMGLRFWLPAGIKNATQTGIYSHFALAGDCEVVFTYEILKLQDPEGGYGSGIGLAFDVVADGGRAMIQRVHKKGDGSGYLLSSGLKPRGKELEEEYKFVASTVQYGRMGMRRIKKELVFLAADTPGGELQEIGRMPFTDRTLSAIRLFADPGGSPTAIDVRVGQIDVRAEEITGGVPVVGPKKPTKWWLWLVVPVAGLGLYGVWWWRKTDAGEPPTQRKPMLKKA
jgi:hypothetical protein